MKKFFSFIIVLCFAFAGVLMTACVDPNGGLDEGEKEPVSLIESEMSAKLISGSEEYSKAELQVTTSNIAMVAYTHAVDEKSISSKSAKQIFEEAKEKDRTFKVKDGKNNINITGLEAAATSTIYLVGVKIDNFYHEEFVKVKVTTKGFEDVTDDFYVFDVEERSISVHMKWPEKVTPGNVLKWGYTDYALYNYNGGSGADWEMLDLHDEVYHNYFEGDKTFYLNEDNRYLPYLNEEGAVEAIALHGAVIAGQPGYFLVGEFQYTPVDYYLRAGWGPGYYIPYFTTNNGYFRKELITSKAPETMRAKPTVTTNLTPKGTGTITITPEEGIYMYAYALIPEDVYYGDMMKVLNNKTEYIQWFVSSETGFYLLSGGASYGPIRLVAEDEYYLKRNTTYHFCITSYGDASGSRQSFYHTTFQLPKPTLPDPTCVVTPAELPADTPEEEKPYLIAFNIKCPTKDAEEVRYIANYERDWEAQRRNYKKQGYTVDEADTALIDTYGGEFIVEDVEKINSDEGLVITIATREDAVTYLGAICYNVEGSPSPVSVAEARSMKEPARTPTTSPLFESLKGEWHVKAPIQGSRYVNNVATEFKVYAEFDVTIGDVGYEATIPEHVYDLYYNGTDLLTKDDVNAVFEQFKTSVDEFNVKNKNQNRLLVQGFDLAQPIEQFAYKFDDESTSITAFRNPYQLFISKDYSGYNYESPVYDFGPKLYLEFDAEGNITVPFNVNYFAPASQWFQYVFHIIGSDTKASLPYITNSKKEPVTGHFPVTVSEDGNTITINGLEYNGSTYYPTLGAENSQQGGYSVPCSVFNKIVMTRKVATSGEETTPATRSAFNKVTDVIPANIVSKYNAKPLTFKSRTAFPAEVNAPQRVKMQVASSEVFHKQADELSRKKGLRR